MNKVRLIDANELKNNAYPFPCAIGAEYAVSIRAINEAPTIDPESLRPHARWISREVDYYCPRCGMTTAYKTKFCYECGAKMDLEEDT